jgi:uncharacterized membrane protein (UPF0127 family)
MECDMAIMVDLPITLNGVFIRIAKRTVIGQCGRMQFWIISIWVIFLAVGCGGAGDSVLENQAKTNSSEVNGTVNTKLPVKSETWDPEAPITKAQPKLRTLKLLVGNPPIEVTAEWAISQQQIATGLMHRKSLGENEGMLFIFAEPKKAAFYMRNTIVPLTVAYLGSSGVIMELHDLEPLNETPVEAQSELVRFVLEMPRDWFKKNDVTEAQKVRAAKGTLLEVFFPEE